jgi:ferritin-like metal-binding protein YciE
MPDPTSRELKLIQYLNEAYGKEKQLETDLQRQIQLATAKAPLKKRLTEHLRETKAQAKNLERRIKALGGKAEAVDLPGPGAVSGAASTAASVANKALAAAKGPVATLRGTSPADNLLRNVRDAYWNEAEEIAHYNTIEAFADKLGDKETVKLAKEHRRQEERMQKFLSGQIKSLVGDVIKSEIPARERKPAGATTTRRRSTKRRTTKRATSRSTSGGTKSTARAKAGAKGGRKTAAKRSTAKSSSGTKRTTTARSTSRKSGSSSSPRGRSSNGASASGSRSRSGSRAKSS